MKIDIEVDDNDYMLSIFEAITVQNLQWDLTHWQLEKYVHPNDEKNHKKRIKAAKVLLKYYKGEE